MALYPQLKENDIIHVRQRELLVCHTFIQSECYVLHAKYTLKLLHFVVIRMSDKSDGSGKMWECLLHNRQLSTESATHIAHAFGASKGFCCHFTTAYSVLSRFVVLLHTIMFPGIFPPFSGCETRGPFINFVTHAVSFFDIVCPPSSHICHICVTKLFSPRTTP